VDIQCCTPITCARVSESLTTSKLLPKHPVLLCNWQLHLQVKLP
jgi:hypothetical protein